MNRVLEASPAVVASDIAEGMRRGVLVGLAVLAIVLPPQLRTPATGSLPLERMEAVRVADFGTAKPSPDARHVANWIAASRDDANANFVIVDKKFARMYVFDADARLRGSSPVLLGSAPGDDSVPDIGVRPIAQVRPEERTTPAGRFVAAAGRNALGEDFATHRAIVYVLPEMKPVRQVFGSYDVVATT